LTGAVAFDRERSAGVARPSLSYFHGRREPGQRRHSSSRLASIDAARGAAMIFVCLSHFAGNYPFPASAGDLSSQLYAIGMIASPTFVSVSGMMAGFMSVARADAFGHFRQKLIDRGVFVLFVGHLVLALTVALGASTFAISSRIEYITDATAISVIIGPTLVMQLRGRVRLVLAAGIFAADWCAVLFWSPATPTMILAKHYLVGLLGPNEAGVPFPAFALIPWFAVYLLGTVIGERVGAYYSRHDRVGGHRILATIGVVGFMVGATAKIGLAVAKRYIPDFAQVHPNLFPLLSSYQKYPPGPVYVCFYASAGLLLIAGVMEVGRMGRLQFAFNQLRQIGQASLFCYVVQTALYQVLLPKLHLQPGRLWPLHYLASLVLLALAAAAWNSVDGNRVLTVGIGRMLERRASRRHGRGVERINRVAPALSD
jgi:uncharacterized membrane protein